MAFLLWHLILQGRSSQVTAVEHWILKFELAGKQILRQISTRRKFTAPMGTGTRCRGQRSRCHRERDKNTSADPLGSSEAGTDVGAVPDWGKKSSLLYASKTTRLPRKGLWTDFGRRLLAVKGKGPPSHISNSKCAPSHRKAALGDRTACLAPGPLCFSLPLWFTLSSLC